MSLAQIFYYKSAKRRKENKTVAVFYLYLCLSCYLCNATAVVSSANENFNNYLDSYSSKFNQDNILDELTFNSSVHHHSKRYQKVRKKTLEDYEALPDNHINSNSVENLPLENGFQSNDDVGTLYMGYPKNPFGASSRWNEKYSTNHASLNEIISTDSSFNAEHDHNRVVETREKRGVTHLYNMVSCATGCNPLSYKGYGCYCGFLGSGRITDRIDRCCMMHDVCYASVNCPVFLVYFMPYLWKCWRGRPLCAIDHLSYGRAGGCAARLCECDRELAMCLSHSPCPNRRALCTSSPWRLLQNIVMNV